MSIDIELTETEINEAKTKLRNAIAEIQNYKFDFAHKQEDSNDDYDVTIDQLDIVNGIDTVCNYVSLVLDNYCNDVESADFHMPIIYMNIDTGLLGGIYDKSTDRPYFIMGMERAAADISNAIAYLYAKGDDKIMKQITETEMEEYLTKIKNEVAKIQENNNGGKFYNKMLSEEKNADAHEGIDVACNYIMSEIDECKTTEDAMRIFPRIVNAFDHAPLSEIFRTASMHKRVGMEFPRAFCAYHLSPLFEQN